VREERAFYDAVLDHPDVAKMTTCNPLVIARVAEQVHVERLKRVEAEAYNRVLGLLLARRDGIATTARRPDQNKAYREISRVMSDVFDWRDKAMTE
jgi:hypothetical protein